MIESPPRAEHGVPDCLPEVGCITCGDEGVEMRALKVDAGSGLAVCVDPAGSTSEVDLGIVAAVEPGDALLVHAGVALTRLGSKVTA
ncbi:MAG: HypC/HybG/HupF family hydrogenase formation chaperone [Thermoleophilaceae bacterium]|nr:HypC/HybG/HupF family hydrogenase formation chaperone [Actinomycetota bacterium]